MSTSTSSSHTSGGKELPPGTRLEEFVIERVLGSGGFGITYQARDVSLNRSVVIKENLPSQFAHRDTSSLVVKPGLGREDENNFRWSMENFSREAETLASLHHSGIVSVLRRFEAFGTAYFVMPYVEGVPFDVLIEERHRKNNPFSEEELRGLLERTLSALAYLHERGIYHRDIKPGNILITNEGLPVLIDFGSARQRLSERSMTVVESAGYTPFEQLQSRGNVGPWSDLYALAATMVKVMLGEAPPKANDRGFGDPWQPLTGRVDLVGRYSEIFLQCLDRALRLPIEERWKTADDWNSALVRGVVPEVESHREDHSTISSSKVSTKKPSIGLRWSFAAVAFLTVVSGCVWWLTRKDAQVASAVAPVPLTGGLVITSEPSGAELRSSSEVLGETPVELTGLSAGRPWQGTLAMDGYDTVDVKAEVVPGETKLVAPVKLKPQAQKVIVSSDPSDAEVVEGDKVLGRTPMETDPREVGESVVLTLRKEGYDDAQVSGEVELGKSLVLQGNLKAKPRWGGKTPGEEKVIELAPGVTMTFCWIPPGDFEIGSPVGELGREPDENLISTRITKGFWLAKTEVTQSHWRAVMGTNPSGEQRGEDLPVVNVSWDDTQEYIVKLNAMELSDGVVAVLPTEAQWEYACRAGRKTSLNNGRNLTTEDYEECMNLGEVAWYRSNSEYKTYPVGRKRPNAWGLHDMHGNVSEWCADWYGDYASGLQVDPSGPVAGAARVIRGGNFSDAPRNCRSAYRTGDAPGSRGVALGLRLSLQAVVQVESIENQVPTDHGIGHENSANGAAPMSNAARLAGGLMPMPRYPSEARNKGLSGTVLIEFTVDASGRVSSAHIASPCPWSELNEEALRAVKNWKFPPGREMTFKKPIVFKLSANGNGQTDGGEDQSDRSAVEAYNLLEQEKRKLESQIGDLLKYDNDQLMVYAAGLDLPDNIIRNLYPQYLEAKRQLDGLRINGCGAKHPSVMQAVDQIENMKRQLDEGVVNFRATLTAQLDLATDRLKSIEKMKDQTLEKAINSPGTLGSRESDRKTGSNVKNKSKVIPMSFHGVWTYNKSRKHEGGDDYFLEIGDKTIEGYEIFAEVNSVEIFEGSNQVCEVDVAAACEGMESREKIKLILSPDGAHIVIEQKNRNEISFGGGILYKVRK